MRLRTALCVLLVSLPAAGCLDELDGPLAGSSVAADDDPPEVALGERLFLETRFAQFFAAHASSANATLFQGDPALDESATAGAPLPGPFLGQSMNCAACHLVDQQFGVPGGGMRSYDDFARRSPIPERFDGRTRTPRNSPTLVGATIPGPAGVFLHFDGQFASTAQLVRATLTGRNYGWLEREHTLAVAHIASIIREDDGSGALAAEFGGLPYATLLDPPANTVPAAFYLRPPFRLRVATASDEQILDAVALLIAAYVDQLRFQTGPGSELFSGSPYDRFLAANGLPRAPAPGESALAYSRRLRGEVAQLGAPVWIQPGEQSFVTHEQPFEFGALELEGLRAFLREPSALPPTAGELAAGGIGNCLACHALPRASDGSFHNVGASQEEYESLHGAGSFASVVVPDLATRSADFESWLPPTAAHPDALGPLLAPPAPGRPELADLGLWNVFANPDELAPQARLRALLCAQFALDPAATSDADLLPRTLGYFKTPGLRDLGHSGPYMHTGRFDALEDVLAHYRAFSALARAGGVRNASPELSGIALLAGDVPALAAFLRSLNEDYE